MWVSVVNVVVGVGRTIGDGELEGKGDDGRGGIAVGDISGKLGGDGTTGLIHNAKVITGLQEFLLVRGVYINGIGSVGIKRLATTVNQGFLFPLAPFGKIPGPRNSPNWLLEFEKKNSSYRQYHHANECQSPLRGAANPC